jgi:hypothetical protein
MNGVTAAEKAAILSHYSAQAALAAADPDDLTLDVQSAIEHMVIEAGRAERALLRGDLMAAADIIKSAGAHVVEVMS